MKNDKIFIVKPHQKDINYFDTTIFKTCVELTPEELEIIKRYLSVQPTMHRQLLKKFKVLEK